MKLGAVLLALACGAAPAAGGYVRRAPIAQVAALLTELKARIEADGQLEQASYDKYACWIEDALSSKAVAITAGKDQIEVLVSQIVKLNAEIATLDAEVVQLKKDVAGNQAAQNEAKAVREKAFAEYQDEKTELEQCLGALEAAIAVLAGAGEARGAIGTMREAQLLSVVAGIRGVLTRPAISKAVSDTDWQVVRKFVEHPEAFVGGRSGFLSAVQTAGNPFGDYAPRSTQIQGILKQMNDSFTGDLAKAMVDEAKAEQIHSQLMATKQSELQTLQATLSQHQFEGAEKTKSLADSKEMLDDTRLQLQADQQFFEQTKFAGQVKAGEWSSRTRLRTEELAGVNKAIQILTDPQNAVIFQNASLSFIQIRAATNSRRHNAEVNASAHVMHLAQRLHSFSLSQAAAQLSEGGHFDNVIAAIDQMVANLRKEALDDIAHRDRCQNSERKNSNDIEDLNHAINRANTSIALLADDAQELQAKASTIQQSIDKSTTDMENLRQLRIQEVDAFRQGQKDDADAIALLEEVLVALTNFYSRNRVDLSLVRAGAGNYTANWTSGPPETTWSGSYHDDKRLETRGIVAIISMIKEDLHKEMETAQREDANAQVLYEKDSAALRETIRTQMAVKLATEKDLSALEAKVAGTEELITAKENDLDAQNRMKDALYHDCSWVDGYFDSRATKRNTEIASLVEAKGYLAGMESDAP